jgi:large subunit ribosomal protein L10
VDRAEKDQMIEDLHTRMKAATVAIIAEYKGLDVATATDIRKKCRDNAVDYRVVKNTLAKRAAKGTSVEVIAESFKGPVVLILGNDPVTPAKVMTDFAKDREEKFQLRVAVVEGQKVDAKGIQALAKMPGIQELRAQIAGMLMSPAGKLARLIATPGQQVARVIVAHREKIGS